jgi:hypothetical protein
MPRKALALLKKSNEKMAQEKKIFAKKSRSRFYRHWNFIVELWPRPSAFSIFLNKCNNRAD